MAGERAREDGTVNDMVEQSAQLRPCFEAPFIVQQRRCQTPSRSFSASCAAPLPAGEGFGTSEAPIRVRRIGKPSRFPVRLSIIKSMRTAIRG